MKKILEEYVERAPSCYSQIHTIHSNCNIMLLKGHTTKESSSILYVNLLNKYVNRIVESMICMLLVSIINLSICF